MFAINETHTHIHTSVQLTVSSHRNLPNKTQNSQQKDVSSSPRYSNF